MALLCKDEMNMVKHYSNGIIYSTYNGSLPGADDMPSSYVSAADYDALAATAEQRLDALTKTLERMLMLEARIAELETAIKGYNDHCIKHGRLESLLPLTSELERSSQP